MLGIFTLGNSINTISKSLQIVLEELGQAVVEAKSRTNLLNSS
jgi:hypothetical protein